MGLLWLNELMELSRVWTMWSAADSAADSLNINRSITKVTVIDSFKYVLLHN